MGTRVDNVSAENVTATDQVSGGSLEGGSLQLSDSEAGTAAELFSNGILTVGAQEIDLTALGGGADEAILQLQNNLSMLFFEVDNVPVRQLEDAMVDGIQDTDNIDLTNSEGLWDATNKCWTYVPTGTGQTATVDFDSVDTFTQRDPRDTITWYNRTGTNTGIFQTAEGGSDVTVGAGQTNPYVIVGCLVTIGEESYTITAISGADHKTVTLDGDASSAACSQVVALIQDNGLVLNSYYEVQSPLGSSGVGTDGSANYTCMHSDQALTPGCLLTGVRIMAAVPQNNIVVKVCEDLGGGQYNVVDLQTFAGPSSGYEYILSDPWKVPVTGTYYLAIYFSATKYNYNTGSGGFTYKAGDVTGNQSSWSVQTNWPLALLIRLTKIISPAGIHVALSNTTPTKSDALGFNATYWADINSASLTYSTPGSSVAYGAVCFNYGDAAEKWYTVKSGTTASIAELTSGTWQYRDSGDSLANASVNDRYIAISEGMDSGSTPSRWTPTEIAAVSDADWNDIWTEGTTPIVWALGLKASGADVPSVENISMNFDYGASPVDITLIFDALEASQNDPVNVNALLHVVQGEAFTVNTDIKVWISINNGSNYEQLTIESTPYRTVGTSKYYRATLEGITARTDATCLFKVSTHNGKDVRVSGASFWLSW